MDEALQDRQPGVTATGITGLLTLTKTGTTARTATFPDAAITVAGLEVANVFTAAQTMPAWTATGSGALIRCAVFSSHVTGQADITFSSNSALKLVVGAYSAGAFIDQRAGNLEFRYSGTTYGTFFAGGGWVLGAAGTDPGSGNLTVSNQVQAVSLKASGLTSGRVPYVTTGGLLTDDVRFKYGSGALTVGDGTGVVGLNFDGTSADKDFSWKVSGVLRWIFSSGGTESGSDSGSLWRVRARTDAGAAIDDPISIVRAAGGAITLARPVTCTGAVTVPNGTAAAPGIRLTSEAHGLYRFNSTTLGFAVSGVYAALLTDQGVLAAATIQGGNGTAAAPGIRTTTYAHGLFSKGSTSIGLAAAGVEAVSLFAPGSGFGGGLQFNLPVDADFGYIYSSRTNAEFRISAGSSSTNGANIQIFGSAHATPTTGRLRASTASVLEWTATGITAAQNLTVPNGTASAPGIRTTTYAHGLYDAGATVLGASVDGVSAIYIGKPNGTTYGGSIQLRSPSAGEVGAIYNGSRADGAIYISGSNGYAAGGNIRLFGNAHATKADYVEFTRGTTVSAFFDGSGILTTNAGRKITVRSVTSAAGTTTLDGTDHCAVLTGSTTQTFTLPAAASGRVLFIKNRSTGNLTVNRAGADTIDGTTTVVLTAGQSLQIVANGTDWVIL